MDMRFGTIKPLRILQHTFGLQNIIVEHRGGKKPDDGIDGKQTARHQEGHVIMYANNVTGSMQRTIDETNRRRRIQESYNKKHNITPTSISKAVGDIIKREPKEEKPKLDLRKVPKDEYVHLLRDLNAQMDLASANLEFEKAAELRDLIAEVKAKI